jgi:hypothetical protein
MSIQWGQVPTIAVGVVVAGLLLGLLMKVTG